MSGYKYFWTCPNCGTSLQLKMRVTQTKRKCPHCGILVTPQEIDRQQQELNRQKRNSALLILGLIWILFILCAIPTMIPADKIIELLIGIIVIAGIAFVVYVGYKILRRISNTERTFEADETSDAKKAEFLSSPDFQLVRDFVQSGIIYEVGSFEKLHQLTQNKGWNFTPEQFEDIVTEETDAYSTAEQSIQIADEIRARNPSNREAYLRAYIEFSHPHENDYLHVLANFLKISEHEYPKLRDELTSLSKTYDLDEFERRLRDQSDS